MVNLPHFKEKLENELKTLEGELKTVGHVNPKNPDDWEATPDKLNADSADRTEVADQLENYEANTAILKQLEIQLGNVKQALLKIEDGTYGICEVCGIEIPEERLEAMPSSTKCIDHANS
jgi:RNA polymerase-binding transcription factor DksA